MKNMIIFYLAILPPIPILIWISISGDSRLFAILLLVYVIPYRTLIDGLRLVTKNVIKWNEIGKLLIPWKRSEFFKDLYFNK
jgi:hypothetical protein